MTAKHDLSRDSTIDMPRWAGLGEGWETPKPQRHTKNYKQLRNANTGRNSLSQER